MTDEDDKLPSDAEKSALKPRGEAVERGDDAEDHAPKPRHDEMSRPPQRPNKQDAPNYDSRTDEGQAIERENVSSANDE